jgi:hypothetical protein
LGKSYVSPCFKKEEKMNTELLRLFNAVYVTSKEEKPINPAFLERGIMNGYVLSPYIDASVSLLETIESVVGISGEKANASFHKSWSVINDSTIEQLVIQQIVHYITTYGFERLGIYSSDTVYIPHEVLELPEITENLPLTVIKAMNRKEILDNILVLAASGIALSQETLTDIMVVIKGMDYPPTFVSEVKNRELKALLYDHYDIAPTEPVEYLRYVVSKLTGKSLLIKNDELIGLIKASDQKVLDNLLKNAPHDLASIFYRYKPLFLAMKSISRNKTFFNRLRKYAVEIHKPLPEDYLNSITAKIKSGEEVFDFNKFNLKIKEASTFRKIRLAYALNSRLHAGDSIVYKVRNGRGWAEDFEWNTDKNDFTSILLGLTFDAIAKDIKPKVDGKVVYVPSTVHYALPATEKQFLGNIPANSYVSVPSDMVVGIHWYNTGDEKKSKRNSFDYWGYDNGRVDLDLSLLSLNSKYGWDGYYRSDARSILFSGDMTDAPKPHGASEFFYIQNVVDEAKTLYVNYFNFNAEGVECKLIIASEPVKSFTRNYMVNVNNILASANVKITKQQNLLGIIMNVDEENRFYFSNTSIGNSITTRNNEVSAKVNKFMRDSCQNILEFTDVLERAGATVVREKPVEGEYIDLSPEALDKTTFIKLLSE